MKAQDSYQIQVWYVKASDRLYSDPKVPASVSSKLLESASSLGAFQINQYQWIVAAPASDLIAYANSH